MIWVVDVAAAVVGLAVLALLAVRLWRQVRDLGREVTRASDRFAAAQRDLDAAPMTRPRSERSLNPR